MKRSAETASIDTVTLGSMEEGMTWVGRVAEPFLAPDQIEFGAIRHFCELVEDPNPVYFDETAAAKSVWGGTIAPPGSLQIWCMPLTWTPPGIPHGEPPRLHRRVPLPGNRLIALGIETNFLLPLRVGDRLRYVEGIESITPKVTRLGEGAVIRIAQSYSGSDGRVRATQTISAFRYKASSDSPSTAVRGSRGEDHATDLEFLFPVSLQRCVLCVSATRDYNPFHYDRDFARAGGAPDAFLNVMAYQGLFGRLVTDWGGPDAMLRRLSFRMIGMNIPGDVARVCGKIVADRIVDGRREADLAVEVHNGRAGLTTEGKATVRWPTPEEVA